MSIVNTCYRIFIDSISEEFLLKSTLFYEKTTDLLCFEYFLSQGKRQTYLADVIQSALVKT
jgi:hypothetical protein